MRNLHSRARRRGSILALMLVIVVLLAGLAGAFASYSLSSNRFSGEFNRSLEAAYGAEGALEQVKMDIELAGYVTAGNAWLLANALPDNASGVYPQPGDKPVYSKLAVGRCLVDAYVYSTDSQNSKYRAVAVAKLAGLTVRSSQDILARDSFARFATFVDQAWLNFGKSIVRGAVHSNQGINFRYGGAQFTENVSAVSGFTFLDGATEANTTFFSSDRAAGAIKMPSFTEIAGMRSKATGAYDVHNSNPFYGSAGAPLDARIVFLSDQIQIEAVQGGVTVGSGTYAIPADGVIYVEGNVLSIEGTMRGAITVATNGGINVTGSITYEDQNGDPAYRLVDSSGTPVPISSTTVAWDSSTGYRYEANPSYNPSKSKRPVVGLMAQEQVLFDSGAPYNLELHAAVFSANSNWQDSLSSSKGNLRTFGSLSTKLAGARSQYSSGYSLSGEYIYDTSLLASPPPAWLRVEKTFWGARWRG